MNDRSKSRTQWTIRDVLEWTADHFGGKGIASPRLDAEILLAHTLGADRIHLYMNLDRPLLPDERDRYRSLVRRRGAREPVALITGVKEFWSIPLRVVPGILIPRPETEILVESVLEEIKEKPAPTVLEIGTGSGAVAIAVAHENQGVKFIAVDVDPRAVEIAEANANAANVSNSLECRVSDLLTDLDSPGEFDVICSNPPYIPSDVIDTLEPEIARFEPRHALDGGPDGLDVIRRLARETPDFLKDNGALILEMGDGQERDVREILTSEGRFREIRVFPDLSGKARVIKGRR